MKRITLTISSAASIISFFFITPIFAQTNWIKHFDNPVMVRQNADFETFAIGQPTCTIENDTIKMWYVGAGLPLTGRILYAWSLNGINWIKYKSGTPVLDVGASGEWDCKWLDTPEIVKDVTGYKLYYFGDTTKVSPPLSAAIGVAISSDGVKWQKYVNNPVLSKGNPGDWDGYWIESPAVLYDDSRHCYQMWYTGVNTNWIIQIGLATSPDGFTWTKYPKNPVLEIGPPGSWDDMWVAVPAVIKTKNLYEMWYSGFSSVSGFDNIHIGYAFSRDGINWTKYSGNPLFSTITPPYDSLIERGGPWAPDVVFDGFSYKMWYETAAGFCLTTASMLNSVTESHSQPQEFYLWQNYPNPFNPTTTIRCSLSKTGHLRLIIYDLSGRYIKTLIDAQQPAGLFQTIWDSTNEDRQPVAAGIYFCFLEVSATSNSFSSTYSGAGSSINGDLKSVLQAGRGFMKIIKLVLVK